MLELMPGFQCHRKCRRTVISCQRDSGKANEHIAGVSRLVCPGHRRSAESSPGDGPEITGWVLPPLYRPARLSGRPGWLAGFRRFAHASHARRSGPARPGMTENTMRATSVHERRAARYRPRSATPAAWPGSCAGRPAGWYAGPVRNACADCRPCRIRCCARQPRWAGHSSPAAAARDGPVPARSTDKA